jgi:hypothetical protein
MTQEPIWLMVARGLLGEPRADLSVDDDYWFGVDGMFQLNVATGDWRDHGNNKEGAGAVDMVRWLKGLERTAAGAWIVANIPAAAASPALTPVPPRDDPPVEPVPWEDDPEQVPLELPPGDPNDRRWLPDDLERERDLLGLLLADVNLIDAVETELVALDFSSIAHGTLFQAICAARTAGDEITLALVTQALATEGKAEIFPGYTAAQYAAHLIAAAPIVGSDAERGVLARDLGKMIAEEARLLDGGEPVPESAGPYQPKFGLIRWGEQSQSTKTYQWLIKHVIPLGESVLMIGRSGCGKSFTAFDMGMHVARGIEYRGRKVKRMGVILLCYEGGVGVSLRMQAYAQANDIKPGAIPFAALTRPPNVYASEENIEALAAEIIEVTKSWTVPLGVIIVDTHNAATRGSSEIKSEDVSLILNRYESLRAKTGAGLWIIGHTNTEGRHRGNEQIANGIETTLRVELVEQKGVGLLRDDDGRVRHRVVVEKQREGQDKIDWEFVLPQIILGTDEDGDPITSCVARLPNRTVEEESHRDDDRQGKQTGNRDPSKHFRLRGPEVVFFRAMLKALADGGMAPPAGLQLPPSVQRVITYAELAAAYKSLVPYDESNDEKGRIRYRERIKTRLRRARETLQTYRVIGLDEVKDPKGDYHVLWPTGRPVIGAGFTWPSAGAIAARVERQKDELPIDEATGQPITSLDGTTDDGDKKW